MGNADGLHKGANLQKKPTLQIPLLETNQKELKKINWLKHDGELIQIKNEANLNKSEENQTNLNSDKENPEEIIKIKSLAEVVIIGAGPVGLWISILFKTHNPNISIIIYERHPTYIRSNNIKLPKGEKFEVPNIPSIKEMLEKKFVPIQEIEHVLKTEADKLNVKIIYEKISSLDQISYQNHQAMKLIVAADGAHSVLRDLIFVEKPLVTNLFNLVQVVYKTHGKAGDMNYFKKYAVLKKVDLFVEDTQIENQVNLRFFVSNETFEKVKMFTVKNPCLDYNEVGDIEFKQKLLFWMKARKYYIGQEKIIKDSFKLTAFNLDCYRAPKFGKTNIFDSEIHSTNQVPMVLCGDSAFGVPFYRSLRNGWKCAADLVKFYFESQTQNNQFVFYEKYESTMSETYEEEKSRASVKYNNVNMFSKFCKISSQVPWQIVFLTKNKANIINNIELDVA